MDTFSSAQAGHRRQSWRFLLLYALAAAGGSASYAPFLTLLLPLRATELWGERGIEVLSYAAFAGALAASLANIAFGWVSDRTRNRRGWIVLGMVLSCILLVSMRWVASVPALLAMIVLWQIALNIMLSPLMAWAGDCVPDEQKGTLGGLLAIAPAMGALTGALITIPGLAEGADRLSLNAVLVAAMILPVILFGKPGPMPQLTAQGAGERSLDEGGAPIALRQSDAPVVRMWLVRLLIQIAEAALFAFLLIWLRGLDETTTENRAAQIFTFVLFASVPLALAVGRMSDRAHRPRLPLTITAAGASFGLLVLAMAQEVTVGIAGYVLFGIMAAIFLSLHSSQTLRVLPRPATRARDLGIFNLTNTVPSLIMPWLVLALIPMFGFQALFLVLAGLAALAAALLATMRRF